MSSHLPLKDGVKGLHLHPHSTALDYEGAVEMHARIASATVSTAEATRLDIEIIVSEMRDAYAQLDRPGSLHWLEELSRWVAVAAAGDISSYFSPVKGTSDMVTVAPSDARRLASDFTKKACSTAKESSTVYVSSGAIERALERLREDTPLCFPTHNELPFDPGLYVFAKPLVYLLDTDEKTYLLPIHAAQVYRHESTSSDDDRWVLLLWSDHRKHALDGGEHEQERLRRLRQQVGGDITVESFGTFIVGSEVTTEKYDTEFRFFAALMSVLAEPEGRVATVESTTRARKVGRRARLPKPGEVHVIYMRKEAKRLMSEGAGAKGGAPRRHRVRGHWRYVPYGPRELGESRPRRWTYIDAHERGKGDLVETKNVWKAT